MVRRGPYVRYGGSGTHHVSAQVDTESMQQPRPLELH